MSEPLPPSLLTVVYTAEPDQVYEYSTEGQSRLFGRDDRRCDIVIWSAINGNELSRIAGRIWRMDNELWLRNLSTTHELTLTVTGQPGSHALPIRTDDPLDPGPARAIPGREATITAPDGCELVVRQQRAPVRPIETDIGDQTVRPPAVPPKLLPIAQALCAPLFAGGLLPATYSEVARAVGDDSLRRVRGQVAELRELYENAVPQLRQQAADRQKRAEDELTAQAAPARGAGGVVIFEAASPGPGARRPHGLPDYFEVAHLLVRLGLVRPQRLD